MALSYPALLNYGFEITNDNQYINFKTSSMGSELSAVLDIGSYSLSSFLVEVMRAMNAAGLGDTFTATVDRSIGGGLQNRVTISTSGSFLSLLFGSGSQAAASPASLLGFAAADRTGATSYTGVATAGFTIVSVYPAYTFVSTEQSQMVFGSVNIAADGSKEALVWQIQEFPEAEFMHEPKDKVDDVWQDFFRWAIQQQPFEITPSYADFDTVYQVTLEATEESNQGLGFKMQEMLPEFPNFYRTGRLKFRRILITSQFLA